MIKNGLSLESGGPPEHNSGLRLDDWEIPAEERFSDEREPSEPGDLVLETPKAGTHGDGCSIPVIRSPGASARNLPSRLGVFRRRRLLGPVRYAFPSRTPQRKETLSGLLRGHSPAARGTSGTEYPTRIADSGSDPVRYPPGITADETLCAGLELRAPP